MSQAIAAAGHDPATGELRLRFRNGGMYAYRGVPPPVFAAFRAAPSKGRFFHEAIDGRYPFVRLDRPR